MKALQLTHINKVTEHCDTKCHTSTSPRCHCICQGLLHGKGEKYAQANKRRAYELLMWQADFANLSVYPPKDH